MRGCRVEITAGAAVVFPTLFYLDDSGVFSAVLPAVFFHEIGHCISARMYGGRILSLRISLSGLCLDTTPFSSPLSEAVCAAAGPVCGLLWAALCSQIPGEWWERCRDVSLYFSVCNLLPAQPLDGGRILHALCRNRKAVQIVTVCTGVICLVSAALTCRWGFALPAVCILAAQLRALRRGGFPWPGAPSATPVPEIQRESARSRFGSGHGKTED